MAYISNFGATLTFTRVPATNGIPGYDAVELLGLTETASQALAEIELTDPRPYETMVLDICTQHGLPLTVIRV